MTTRRASRTAIVRTIVAKDVKAFSRDTVWVMLSVLGLVAYVAIFYILPDSVSESITMGVVQTDMEMAWTSPVFVDYAPVRD